MEITDAKKGSDQYIMDICDFIIGDLVKEKTELFKAYNYFNGVRDHYQYEHLEKNYGVGNPTSVGFTPLTRKHIEAIVGEYLSMKPQPKISCKDSRTLTNIYRDKQLALAKKTKDWISNFLTNATYEAIIANGRVSPQKNELLHVDKIIEKELNDIKDSIDRNFISNYEIAAQDIIEYVRLNREIDFTNKLELLLLDLLIAGQAYYKIIPTKSITNFKLEICDPLNTWVEKDPKSRYMKNAYKSVVRKWMSPEEIEIKYGDFLSKKDLDHVKDWKNFYDDNTHYALITGLSARCGNCDVKPGIWAGAGIHPFNVDSDLPSNLIPVYEVEWIDSRKTSENKWLGICYHATRIGQDIYVLDGPDSINLPKNFEQDARLSINGIWYTNGHGAPYSLILATADLQDQYDLTIYKKDNAIALSGTRGAIIDISQIPENLGDTPEERLLKFQAYRKVGLSIIDTAQDGQANLNTIFNGFDDSLLPGTILGYQLSLLMIEDTVSSITGVFRERLGGILQRDAVNNVEVGLQQSYIITKRYYNAMDTLVKEILTDCIDMAKVVYQNGLSGELILGNEKKFFLLEPQYYTMTSYGIDLADSAEIIKELENIKAISLGYLQSNLMDPEILLAITCSKSLTEMKDLALKTIQSKKEENNQINKLQEELKQAQEQQKQMKKQLEESTRKLAQLNERKLSAEEKDNQIKRNIEWFKVKSDAELKDKELDLIKERSKLEALLLVDNNPKNDEILNNRY